MTPIYSATGKEAHIGDIVRLPDRGFYRIVRFIPPDVKYPIAVGRVVLVSFENRWDKKEYTVFPRYIGVEWLKDC